MLIDASRHSSQFRLRLSPVFPLPSPSGRSAQVNLRTKPSRTAVLAAAVAATCSTAFADQPTSAPQSDTQSEIQMLRSRLDLLEKQQQDQALKESQASKQATVDSVLS